MTKKLLYIFLLLLFSLPFGKGWGWACFAQQPGYEPHDIPTKPDYKWGIGISMGNAGVFANFWLKEANLGYGFRAANTWKTTTYAFGLSAHYSMKGNKSLRIKAQMANENITITDDSRNTIPYPGAFSSYEIKTKQRILSFEPSIIWRNAINRFTIYEGLTLPFVLIGKHHSSDHDLETDTMNIPLSESTGKLTLPSGFAIGIGILSGLDLDIYERLKIGMELTFPYLYSDIEGELIITKTITTFSPYSSFTQTTYTKFKRIGYEFSNIDISIHVLYTF